MVKPGRNIMTALQRSRDLCFRSDEWKNVSEEEKRDVGLVNSDDGEFW